MSLFGWIKRICALPAKDIKSELRTRFALNSLVMFAVVTLVVISFSLGPRTVDPQIHAVLLWVTLFFSSMAGLTRGMVKEVELKTADALRLAVPAEVVYWGKLFFHVALLAPVNGIILVLYYFFMSPPWTCIGGTALIVLLGTLALSGATTLLSAIVARAAIKGSLLPVLAFPVLLPVLLAAVQATRMSLEGRPLADWFGELLMIFFYTSLLITASHLLFPVVWEE